MQKCYMCAFMKVLWDWSRRFCGKSKFTAALCSCVLLSLPLLWLNHHPLKEAVSSQHQPRALCLITAHMAEPRMVSSQKTSFSELPVRAHTKEQIWTMQKPPAPMGWTFLGTQKIVISRHFNESPMENTRCQKPLTAICKKEKWINQTAKRRRLGLTSFWSHYFSITLLKNILLQRSLIEDYVEGNRTSPSPW